MQLSLMVSAMVFEETVFAGVTGRKVGIQELTSTIPAACCTQTPSTLAEYWSQASKWKPAARYKSVKPATSKEFAQELKVLHAMGNMASVPHCCLPSEIPSGLPAALLFAYKYHADVVLRPDDFWVMVCYGLAEMVNNNPKQFQHLFVDHDNQVSLVIRRPEPFAHINWEATTQDFADALTKTVKGDLCSTIACDFSTTGRIEYIASLICLMTTLKHFFEYTVVTGSGIRNVIFLGTEEDWRRLREKTQNLAKYGVQDWVEKMLYIIDNFIETYLGNPDLYFWNHMVDKVDGRGASGFRKKDSDYTGWIISFYPYNSAGNPVEIKMTPEDFPRITLQSPVTLIDLPTNCTHKLTFLTGFSSIVIENEAFCPELSYAFAEVVS